MTLEARQIHLGVIGCGKIGSATLRYIDERSDYISRKMGYELIPCSVFDKDEESLYALGDLSNIKPRIAGSAEEVIDDPETQIILEATGQDGQARDYIMESFRKGKSVVTPNKMVIAKYTRELFGEARRYGQELGFESSVMASVPVINNLRGNTDRIEKYLAILNGTSNLILTHMPERGFEGALEYAQSIGAAEPDASADISGRDTANKNKILAVLSYGADIDYETITGQDFMEGIESITGLDINLAGEFGYKVKLLGKSRLRDDGRLEIGTFPYLLDSGHMLANVDGTNNAIYVDFENRGPQMYYGKGAEPKPTRVAVVDDIIETAMKMRGGEVDIPPLLNDIELINPFSVRCPFYLRLSAVDRPGVLSKLSGILADNDVSIAKVIQKAKSDNESVPIVMLTHESSPGDILNATRYIDRTLRGKITTGETVAIRVENGEIS